MIRLAVLITAPVALPAAWLVGKVRGYLALDVPHPTPPCEPVADPDPIAAMWDRWAAGVKADVETLRAELDDPAAVARWLGVER